MSITIQVFDPAMCCPTGVCGPDVDPELTRIAADMHLLETKGFAVTRYNLGNDPAAFVENEAVQQALNTKGAEVLPITVVNDKIVLQNQYPSRAQLAEWTGLAEADLKAKPTSSIDISIN